MKLTEKELNREYFFNGKIINVRIDTVELEDKSRSIREIVEFPGAVAILAISKKGEVFLVQQFRKPFEKILTEIPAGKLEKNENPINCALRELKEETGIAPDELIELGIIYPSPGFCDEKIYLFLALGISLGVPKPDEDEFLNLIVMDFEEFEKKCSFGEINDAKTICALLRGRTKALEFLSDNIYRE
jgi:ADP-ribose pyrophosphatase